MDSELSETMDELIQLIDDAWSLSRGVSTRLLGRRHGRADAWSVRFEADIVDTEFFLTGSTPSAVLRDALEEAKAEDLLHVPTTG